MVFSASSGKLVEIPFVDVIELQLVGDGPYKQTLFIGRVTKSIASILQQHAVKKRAKKLLDSMARVGSFGIVEI